jgi:hypothetical protein
MMAPARFGLSAAALIMATTLEPSFADMAKGSYTFSSSNNCASSGKMPTDICGFAHANAEAEFEEKAPRYPTRSLCEQVFGAGACSLGFRGADGWAGKKKAIYFSPRQQGFRMTINSDHGITVVPLGAPGLHFSRRSALHQDASINPRALREQATPQGGQTNNAVFGAAIPEGAGGPLPPRPPIDPNFDCSAYLEPDDKGDPRTGCVLAPPNRR